jgi:hypothetical protein
MANLINCPPRMVHGHNKVRCTVVVHDLDDTAHQLYVKAETIYEAGAEPSETSRSPH